ncbi:MAG: YbbR-like domain-containing protein [Solirubrobacterales bacterium]
MPDNEYRGRSTLRLKLLSVLMALMLWVFINDETIIFNKRAVTGVKINYENLQSGLTVTKAPMTVKVRILGLPRSAREIYASVDLAGKPAGTHTLPVEIRPIPGTSVSSVSPSQVSVRIAEIQESVAQVAYKIDTPLADGLELAGVSMNPAECVVRGERSEVSQVKGLQVNLKLDGVSRATALKIPVVPVDENGQPVTGNLEIMPEKVSVYVVLQKSAHFVRVKIEPAMSGAPQSGFQMRKARVEPETVTLIGSEKELAGISSVNTENIDISDKNASFETEVRPKVPAGVSVFPERVRVLVEIGSISGQGDTTP